MSRKYNIRWTSNDENELRKAVRNYNAKITRLEKKDPSNKNALPEKVSVRQMKELIETRKDLNRELASLKRFTKRTVRKDSKKTPQDLVELPGNDYNLKITRWQKEEMSKRAAYINRKRKKRLEEQQDIELKSRGKPLGYTKSQIGMGKQEENSLKPIKPFTRSMTRKDLKKKMEVLLKESQSNYWDKRDLLLKENYIKSLEDNFSPNEIKDITDKIREMDYKDFKKVYDEEDDLFDYSYHHDQASKEAYLNSLRTIWMPTRDDKLNTSRPGFDDVRPN